MKKEVQVHMLPTDEVSGVVYKKDYKNGIVKLSVDKYQESQYHISSSHHLYITTDEEIKEGDWCVHQGKVKQAIGEAIVSFANEHAKKIIATTDKSLTIVQERAGENVWSTWLPQPSQAFIEHYCKVGGLKEVEVEYELPAISYKRGTNARNAERIVRNSIFGWKPKIDSNNCITTHLIEEKMYSREEVIALINKHRKETYNGYSSSKWIKQNL